MIEDLVAMYNNGMSQRDIAKVVGMSQAAIGVRLRKAGICSGRYKGGYIARTIPQKDYVAHEEAEKQEMAEKNAANACLLVEDRIIKLEGVFGKYHVSAKEKFACINVNECLLKIGFENLATFADEIRALARNVGALEESNEMW